MSHTFRVVQYLRLKQKVHIAKIWNETIYALGHDYYIVDLLFRKYILQRPISITDAYFREDTPSNLGLATSLQSLVIENTKVPKTIGHLEELTQLTLRMVKIPNTVFNLSNLKQLTLGNCTLPKNYSFAKMINLKVITINNCKLKKIPEGLPNSLLSCNLSANEITTVTGIPSNLTSLYLNDNLIQKIDNGVLPISLDICLLGNNRFIECNFLAGLINLSKIEMSNNKISTLPTTLPSGLKSMDFSFNKFQFLPRVIETCTNLELLYFDHNLIESIEVDFSKLSKLDDIKLNNNLLTVRGIPDSFSSLFNIGELHMENNLFETIPALIINIPNLISLNMSHNKIKMVSDMSTTLLEFLSLFGNELTEVDFSLFPRGLDDLNLSMNKIHSVRNLNYQMGTGNNLETLIGLDLSHNKLTSIEEISNGDLNHLNLSFNRLNKAPKISKELHFLNLDGNPLNEEEIRKIQNNPLIGNYKF